MAVAYASSSSQTKAAGGGSETITITKPSGLAAGDLLIAVLGAHGSVSDFTLTGWTQIFTDADASNTRLVGLARVATSGDAAATDFSFTYSANAGDGIVGELVRITGTAFVGTANTTSDTSVITSATTTPTFSAGITAQGVGTLFLMGALIRGLTTQSTYAITNNNPTWTEQLDFQIDTTRDAALSLATATSSAAAATGNWTITLADSREAIGYIISIQETTNVSPAPAVLELTASVPTPSISGGATVSPAVAELTTSIPSPTVSTPTPDWDTADKSSSATWTNTSKS